MRFTRKLLVVAAAAALLAMAAPAHAQIWFDGNIYMKFLWGTDRLGTALYNYTAVPGEGLGDNGQGTQLELFLNGKVGRTVQFKASIQSRFNRNFWTNYGGWAEIDCNGNILTPNVNCLGSEFDPRSNQYIKLRNATIIVNPGWSWLDNAQFGENDLGKYDPFVIGRIRYIDRFNASMIELAGSTKDRKFSYLGGRISLPTYFGEEFTSGEFQAADGAWVFQPKYRPNAKFDIGGLIAYTKDIEIAPIQYDFNYDNGRDTKSRVKNSAGGVKVGYHPSPKLDVNGSFYYSNTKTDLNLNDNFNDEYFGFAVSAFSNMPLGDRSDPAFKLNVDVNDPWGKGLSFNMEYFNIGSDYNSMWAAHREADVLLTEGWDSAFAMPGPMNIAYGIFAGSGDAPQPGPPTRTNIGYGGWSNYTVQVPTLYADNQYTDFDEPLAETVIGWKGFTVKPVYGAGAWDVSGEFSYIGYNTDWQMWGDPDNPNINVTSSPYPMMESDVGPGHNYRNAYAPFRDRKTYIGVARAKYNLSSGVEVWGKYKHIKDTDNRMTDPRFLPYVNGQRNAFNANGNSTADFFGNPPTITVNGVTGYQWKPFDSVTDDDRDLKYNTVQFGLGKQLTDQFYSSVQYEYYNVDLLDGNTAFQAYQLHEMSSGKHKKNKLIWVGKFNFPGIPEAGFQFEHNWGSFEPNFGDGFVPQVADETTAHDHHVPVGSLGFFGRYGGWNSLAKRDFTQNRLKGYLKIVF